MEIQNSPIEFTGIFNLFKNGKYGPYVRIGDVIPQNFINILKEVGKAHQNKSITIDISIKHMNLFHELTSIGAKFRFRNNETLEEQWIIQNNSGAPIGPDSRVGILSVTKTIVDGTIYYLLVKEKYGPIKYKFVTGGVENEDPLDALKRELKEEVSLNIDTNDTSINLIGYMYNPNCRPDWPLDYIQDLCLIYDVNIGIRQTLPLICIDNKEILDAKWDTAGNTENITEITDKIIKGKENYFVVGNNIIRIYKNI